MAPAFPLQTLIEALQRADSSERLLQATRELAGCRAPDAAPALVEVLGFNNPGAAVAAVEGLIAIGEPAVDPLLQLDPANYGARAWAVRALAGIGDVRGLETLIDALASDVAASVRRAAARGLGQLRLEGMADADAEAVQRRCLGALLASCGDGEWVVRYAVAVALESLALQHASGAEAPPAAAARMGEIRGALVRLADADASEAPVVHLRAGLALSRLPLPLP